MPSKAKYSKDGFEVTADVLKRREDGEAQMEINEESLSDLAFVDASRSGYRHLKRAMDIFVSFMALIVLFVPFLFVMLLIFVDDPGPVFFRQHRVGLNGKRFRLYKFRSMKIHAPKYMSKISLKESNALITRVGKVLRKFSIDELPQLINVFLGDMSLVGPRPLISDEYEIHKMRMKYGVYTVRPGITGLAQINGRDTVNATEKVRYDVQYIKSINLLTDLKILFLTVPRVLKANGVAEGVEEQSFDF